MILLPFAHWYLFVHWYIDNTKEKSILEDFRDLPTFGSVSDSKTMVPRRVAGLLLGRLDRISIIFMKNFFLEKKLF